MKLIVILILITGFSVVRCKKEPQTQPTIMSSDSTVSGTAQISPDTADNTATVDSTAYDVDSIKNSR